MKVRIYPEKSVVAKLITDKLAKSMKEFREAEAELQAIRSSALVRPDGSTGERELVHFMDLVQLDISGFQDQLDLLDAHAPPECLVEMEV